MRRLDKRPADIVVADDGLAEADAGLGRVADGGGHAGIGHRDDQVGVARLLDGQALAHLVPRFVDRAAEDGGIGAREVDVLEGADR